MERKKHEVIIDSLLASIDEKRSDLDETVIDDLEVLLEIAKEQNDDYLCGYAYYHLAEAYYFHDRGFNDIRRFLLEGIQYQDLSGNHTLVARSYNLLATIVSLGDNMMLAMDNYMTALRYCDEDDHTTNIYGIILTNISRVYLKLNDATTAMDYLKKAIPYIENYHDDAMYERNLCTCYIMMANIYLSSNNDLHGAQKCIRHLREVLGPDECAAYLDRDICFLALEIRMLHAQNDISNYREKIDLLLMCLRDTEVIIDEIEDIYEICKMLLDFDELDACSEVGRIISPIVKTVRISNMRLQFMALQIEYLRKKGDKKEADRIAGRYFDISQEKQKSDAIEYLFAVNVRKSMEDLKKKQADMKQENARLSQQAEYDELTGLPNRYSLGQMSDKLFDRANKEHRSLAVEIFDIDCFKQFNDTFGHQAGDKCLKMVSETVRGFCKSHEHIYAARYGGDEFILMYLGRNDLEVQELAEDLRKRISELHIANPNASEAPIISISQGIRNSVPQKGNRLWDYMYTADNALYQIKQERRGGIMILHNAYLAESSLADAKVN